MEIKVKEVSSSEEKSVQEIEQNLLVKHEEQFSDTPEVTQVTEPVVEDLVEETVEDKVVELNEEDVLSFIKNKYGREINSIEELTQAREEAPELPKDVAAYYKYKQETGRSIEDFVKLNKDIDSVNPDKLLKDYLTRTEKGLDEEDIDSLMEDYVYDEDFDEATDIRKIKLKKKKDIAKAKDFFESEKEKYRVPLESSGSSISEADANELKEYKQYVQQASTQEEEMNKKADWFLKKTNEMFGSEFKGFEFAVDEDKKVTFSPGDAQELKSLHSTPQNFVSKFLDDDGLLKDAEGYHRSLAVAMNPEKFAKFFYEQGKSEAVDDVMRKTKNVNMSDRKTPEITSKGGTQIRAMNPDSGKGLKIRSKKNN
jgi:hypothetical protein